MYSGSTNLGSYTFTNSLGRHDCTINGTQFAVYVTTQGCGLYIVNNLLCVDNLTGFPEFKLSISFSGGPTSSNPKQFSFVHMNNN